MALDYRTCAQEIFSHLGGRENLVSAAHCAARQPLPQRMVKALGDVFVPILPAIVASGLMMGLVEALGHAIPSFAGSDWYGFLDLVSATAFAYLPVLIAVSAARVFGGNIFLGGVVGLCMIHSGLVNAWAVAGYEGAIPTWHLLFFDVQQVGYQGHVIPVIIAVWLMCQIEKRLHKVVPEAIDLFVTPLVSVLTTVFLTFTIIGPIFSSAETYILNFAQWLITVGFGVGFLIVDSAKLLPYAILLAVSGGIAFTLTWFVWKEEAVPAKAEDAPEAAPLPNLDCQPGTVYAPVAGTVVPSQEIPDETFAAGVLGQGVGIQPGEGVVVAPFDGEISSVTDTHHAVGVSSPDGMELLIHVGVDTVAMQGDGFECFVQEGQKVKAGEKLIAFDRAKISAAGHPDVVVVLVTNSDDYGELSIQPGSCEALKPVIQVK